MATTAVDHVAEHVRRLHDLRIAATSVREAFLAKQRAFEIEHAAEIADMKAAQKEADEADTALRMLALAYFADTGERKPTPGVEVKITEAVEYDGDAALAWAKAKGVAVKVSLDAKAFAAIAPTLDADTQKQIGYKVTEQPKAYIATDLAKALGL